MSPRPAIAAAWAAFWAVAATFPTLGPGGTIWCALVAGSVAALLTDPDV